MVLQAFEEYDYKKLNRIWLTYMMVLNKILEHGGHNDYKLGHMKKAKLEKEGRLPLKIQAFKPGEPGQANDENEPPA